MAQIGVEVTIEGLDRPVLLRRLTTDRDWDQSVNFTLASLDANTRSYLLHSQLGTDQVNHKDPKIDALWDQLLRAPTPEDWSSLSHEAQLYIVGKRKACALSSARRRAIVSGSPLSPDWMYGERGAVEADGILPASESADRGRADGQCAHEPHLAILDKVA